MRFIFIIYLGTNSKQGLKLWLFIDKGQASIEIACKVDRLIITEDKDFGEWVFPHQLSGLTIIFLRYEKDDFNLILSFKKKALKSIEINKRNEFITINKNKIRRRII